MVHLERDSGERRMRGDQQGFTLLESLIAMTILAVGLLGLAAMQTMAMTRNVDANDLGRSTNLAAEMIERIHFNRANVGDYNGALGTGIDTNNALTIPPAAQVTARGDYLQWQQNLANSGLDNARGQVTIVNPFGPVALNQTQVTVTLSWTTKVGTTSQTGAGVHSADLRMVSRPASMTLQTVVTPP